MLKSHRRQGGKDYSKTLLYTRWVYATKTYEDPDAEPSQPQITVPPQGLHSTYWHQYSELYQQRQPYFTRPAAIKVSYTRTQTII